MRSEMKAILKIGKAICKSFVDLAYPPLCFSCNELLYDSEILCEKCQSFMELLDPQNRCKQCFSEDIEKRKSICFNCTKQSPFFDAAATAFDYMGPAASLIRKFKYSNQPFLAKGLSAYLAAQYLRLEWPMPDLIVPVPITLTHWLQRGYNQSFLLAEELGLLLQRPVADIIHRSIGDYSQAGLSKTQRMNLNSENFTLKAKRSFSIQDKCVLLIDDVMTTGTTLRHCAKALLSDHPAHLYALAVCKS